MIGIIITGHGQFASGLEQALIQVIGSQPQCVAVDFPVAMTTEQLTQQLIHAIVEVDSGDGVIFMTDLLGGTPFRVASLLCQEKTVAEVLTGTNMQMAAEMLLERDVIGFNEFTEQALAAGHRGITCLTLQLNTHHQVESVEDGI
ncbi:PTS sugar transporter subunit IIA [Photobacterium damselae]|uniref:PTS galactosamine/N-acetylgalactosamine transporter subunit IIA n=1 Tax=Photobacterium damselae TaxID=38293 RepID=UPI0021FFB22A|nr:PTS galactosamine/N-acetylgalactosamine transporter subunit IIA [Photobacterium damselae]ELV7516581.1 PTS sugar transporter subunit IIA [Photobacterium damselae]BDR35848.1 PTS N-acetylgalactosamine transporter subunit IIA [Photobacterium damselae subsp. damselae]